MLIDGALTNLVFRGAGGNEGQKVLREGMPHLQGSCWGLNRLNTGTEDKFSINGRRLPDFSAQTQEIAETALVTALRVSWVQEKNA